MYCEIWYDKSQFWKRSLSQEAKIVNIGFDPKIHNKNWNFFRPLSDIVHKNYILVQPWGYPWENIYPQKIFYGNAVTFCKIWLKIILYSWCDTDSLAQMVV